MKTLFNKQDYQGIIDRLNKLTPDSKAQWGTMNVSQMLAHCAETLSVATGDVVMKRVFIGRILGPLFKKDYLSENPFKPNSPTAPSFKITNAREFETEKAKVMALAGRFHEGGEKGATKHPHAFFGAFEPHHWGEIQ